MNEFTHGVLIRIHIVIEQLKNLVVGITSLRSHVFLGITIGFRHRLFPLTLYDMYRFVLRLIYIPVL